MPVYFLFMHVNSSSAEFAHRRLKLSKAEDCVIAGKKCNDEAKMKRRREGASERRDQTQP